MALRARKQRNSDGGSESPAETKPRRRGSGLAVVFLCGVLALFGGVAAWLTVTAEAFFEDQRASADRDALQTAFILPPREALLDDLEPAPSIPGLDSGPATGESGRPSAADATSDPRPPRLPSAQATIAPATRGVSAPLSPVAHVAPDTGPDLSPSLAELLTPDTPAGPPPTQPAPTQPAPTQPAPTQPPPTQPPPVADPPATATPPAAAPPPVQVAAIPAAPSPRLFQMTPTGALPRVAPDGVEPWQAYSRPFNFDDPRPRVAIIVTDLGQSRAATEAAIQQLPGPITLAFSPYSSALDDWLPLARAAGHETLLTVPLEPDSYPQDDPGPSTLLTRIGPSDNLERLHGVMTRGQGYVGLLGAYGSRFTLVPGAVRPLLQELDQRGILFVDSAAAPGTLVRNLAPEMGTPYAIVDRVIDDIAARDAIDLRLEELENLARERGAAIGMAYHYPVTIERLANWAERLDARGIALAPITAVTRHTRGGR